MVKFFREQIESKIEYNDWRHRLYYRMKGKLRFWVEARNRFAYVKQFGRFEDDKIYWQSNLIGPETPKQIEGGWNLSFRLRTQEDIDLFLEIALEKKAVKWLANDAKNPRQPKLPLDDE